MADFINTIDALGDDAVIDSIINRTITEFKDDQITSIGDNTFYGCTALNEVDVPNATRIGTRALKNTAIVHAYFPLVTKLENETFNSCGSLKRVDFPLVTTIGTFLFQYCGLLETVNMPKLTNLGVASFEQCNRLRIVDLPELTLIDSYAFTRCPAMVALVLRNENTVCKLISTNVFEISPINIGTLYIYVPSTLVDSYKSATNWSTYATQFRALEDYTFDGTVTGKFICGIVSYDTGRVSLSNLDTFTVGSYETTIAPFPDGKITDVSVIMDDIDVTDSVYRDGVINIPVVYGDIYIVAKSDSPYIICSVPLDGSEFGDLPAYKLNVTAGQKLRIHYYLTKNFGYLYDTRGCGGGYRNGGLTVNTDAVEDVSIVSDGYIVFSNNYVRETVNGQVITAPNDRLTGKYLYVEILD